MKNFIEHKERKHKNYTAARGSMLNYFPVKIFTYKDNIRIGKIFSITFIYVLFFTPSVKLLLMIFVIKLCVKIL